MTPLLAKRLSDESLGSRLASGEAAAFDELYRRYAHRLAAYGAHLLGDGAAGDDVAQAAMLKAYGALRDGQLPDRVKPWLYRIAHNVAIDLVVRRREWPTADLPDAGSSDALPVAGVLVAALAALPDRQRRVYVLRELHGLRIDETAAELSLSAAQVEQSLFAARNRLAEQLVFGERLTCVSVQRLAAGPLDGDERRALKSHLRSCGSCRSGLGLRGRALSVLPVTSLDGLRGLLAGAAGGGAPAAAKVGAAFATVTFAAGVPAAVETVRVHRLPVVPAQRAAAHRAPRHTIAPRPSALRRTFASPGVSAPALRAAPVSGNAGRRSADEGSGNAASAAVTTQRDGGGDGARTSGDSGHDGGGSSPIAVPSVSGDGSHGSGSDGGGTTTVMSTTTTASQVTTVEGSPSGSDSVSVDGRDGTQSVLSGGGSGGDGGGQPSESSGGSSDGGGSGRDGGDSPTTTVSIPSR